VKQTDRDREGGADREAERREGEPPDNRASNEPAKSPRFSFEM
jgi:hypothetical protein